MLGRRLPKARRFSYEPYYYDPEKEKREKKGSKIKFERKLSRRSAKARSLVWLIMLLFIVTYLIVTFYRLGKQ